ncbi:MAG: caspase family protein, partial [Bryobacterales bacterium]|nr:caspase family protein [Bryobacterales bacterium]
MIFHYCSVILLGVVALGQCHAATWALLVGISTYGNELALQEHEQLRFPETDAEGLHAILLSKEGGNIPPGNVRLLLGKDATRQNLAVALGKWLPAVAGPDDTVIIYFSGHGHYERGAGYLVTWDARRAAIASTSYPMADLRRALAALRARSKIVFTDACHAGALNQSVDATGKLRENLLDLDRSVFSLAASAASQQALELSNPEDRHTLFSQFLISGLAGHADLNCDGSVTAAELAAYVREEVIGESNGAQEPTWSPKQGLDRLLLARYSKPRCVSAATKRGSLLVDTPGLACNDTRNSAVLLFDGIVAGTLCGAGKLRIPGVASGPHSVRIERTGFLPVSTTVQVPPGAQASVRAALQPRSGMPASLVDELAKAERGYWKGGDQDLKKALATLDRIAARQP